MDFDSAARAKWITHQGKRILRLDYRGLTDSSEQVALLEEETMILEQSVDKVLVLADFTGASGTPEYMSRLNEAGKRVRTHKVEKTAVLGVTGLKAILLDSYIRFTGDDRVQPFDSEDAALDWLVQ